MPGASKDYDTGPNTLFSASTITRRKKRMRQKILVICFLSFIPASVFSEPVPITITVQNWQCYEPPTNSLGGPYKPFCIENVTITTDSDIDKHDWNGGRWCLHGDQTFAAHGAVTDAALENDKVTIEFVDAKGKRHRLKFYVKSHSWERLSASRNSWSDQAPRSLEPLQPYVGPKRDTGPGK